MASNWKAFKKLTGEWGSKARKSLTSWGSVKAKIKKDTKEQVYEAWKPEGRGQEISRLKRKSRA